MAIPDYQNIMLPLLKFTGDQREHSMQEAVDTLAQKEYKLTEDERKELLPSGQQGIFQNRVAWAKTYLKKAGLIDSTRRGYIKINNRGLAVLKKSPIKIDVQYLGQYQEFRDFRAFRHKKEIEEVKGKEETETTPEEELESAYQNLRDDLASDLLQQIKSSSSSFFEKLVVELLVKMGYGGSRVDAGKAIGKTSDEGIDGIIKEDKLGLDVIYIQAKRWDNTVGRPEVQKFEEHYRGNAQKKE